MPPLKDGPQSLGNPTPRNSSKCFQAPFKFPFRLHFILHYCDIVPNARMYLETPYITGILILDRQTTTSRPRGNFRSLPSQTLKLSLLLLLLVLSFSLLFLLLIFLLVLFVQLMLLIVAPTIPLRGVWGCMRV